MVNISNQNLKQQLKLSNRLNSQLLKASLLTQKKNQLFVERLIRQQEEDRKEISRELHDEIAQLLAGINFELSIISKEASLSGKKLIDKIASAQILVSESVEVIHRFARQLRPMILDDLGLIPALKSYIQEFSKQSGIECVLHSAKNIKSLEDYDQTVLFRVGQEALANIAKHSKATKVILNLTKLKTALKLEVIDNGKSFKIRTASTPGKHKGMGLLIMEERVKIAGGIFTITSSPQIGTKISASIPLLEKNKKNDKK
jgi:signal transduction histidine kinase